MRKRTVLSAIALLAATGCVSIDVTPLSVDMMLISARSESVCGSSGTKDLAFRQAAIETLRAGYDGFIIVDADAESRLGVVGYTPMTANTSYGYGSATTTITGGDPVYSGWHEQDFIIKMMSANDPLAEKALDARTVLGEDWLEIIESKNKITCF